MSKVASKLNLTQVGRVCDAGRAPVRHQSQRDPREDHQRRARTAPPTARPDSQCRCLRDSQDECRQEQHARGDRNS